MHGHALETLAISIQESEKQNATVLPSTNEFEKLICTLNEAGKAQSFLASLSGKTFKGYDPYLLKQLLLATKKFCQMNQGELAPVLAEQLDELISQEAIPVAAPKKLGGGKYNSVYLVEAVRNGKLVKRVWKPVAISNKKAKEGAMASSALSGIPREATHAKYIERSVLTYRLDQLLYGEEGTIVSATEKTFTLPDAISENPAQDTLITSGVFMELADGSPIVAKKLKLHLTATTDDMETYGRLLQTFPALKNHSLQQFLTAAQTDKRALQRLVPDLDVKIEGDLLILENKNGGFPKKFTSGNAASNALEASMKLGILDYISGQTDRHFENYFIDGNGKLMAIDNDLSFGSQAGARGQSGMILPNNASLLVNLPRVMTQKVKAHLVEFFNGKSAQFLAEVAQTFPENSEEYQKTVQRLSEVEALLNNQTIPVIGNSFGELIANSSRIDSETNYIARDLLVTKKGLGPINKQGWNPYRANRTPIELTLNCFVVN